MIVQGKDNVIFTFNDRCFVHIYQRQKWEAFIGDDAVTLMRKGVRMEIGKSDFEKYFREVDE